MLKKIMIILTSLLMSVSFSAAAAESGGEAAYALSLLGIADDTGDMRLDENISRAEAIKMICLAARLDTDSAAAGDPYFPDVPTDHWAIQYINAGYEHGIINGNEYGLFCPENTITSAEMQKMLVCALGYSEYAKNTGGYPRGYLSYASSLGILKGVSTAAAEPLIRGNAMTMIYNSLDVPIMETSYPDNGENGTVTARIYDGSYYPFRSFRTDLSEN